MIPGPIKFRFMVQIITLLELNVFNFWSHICKGGCDFGKASFILVV